MENKNILRLQTLVFIVFGVLSVLSVVQGKDIYLNIAAYEDLFLTNLINAAVMIIFLAVMLFSKGSSAGAPIRSAMLLFIIYSCIPVFLLISSILIKILTAVVFIISVPLFLENVFQNRDGKIRRSDRKIWRIIAGLIPVLFAVIFFFRGVNNIFIYITKDLSLTDLTVSISDILISIFWFAAGLGYLLNKSFGIRNIFSVYLNSSLLFLTLLIFLILNPLLKSEQIDVIGAAVIAVMGLFFFIPAAILRVTEKG